MRRSQLVAAAAAAAVCAGFGLSTLFAQQEGSRGAQNRGDAGKPTVVEGKLVDLHEFMTSPESSRQDRKQRETPQERAGRERPNVRPNGTCALESDQGLIILGDATGSQAMKSTGHVGQTVKVSGKLYEKSGVKYLEVESVRPSDEPGNERRTP